MTPRPLCLGVGAANDDEVALAIDLLHAVARGDAVPITRDVAGAVLPLGSAARLSVRAA